MQRRHFLKAGLGAGAAAAVLPGWSAALVRPGASQVTHAIKAGRAKGKPVLVLLVPDGPEEVERMHLWSELLSVASDATLAELALCEVVCARSADAAAATSAAGITWPEPEEGGVAILLELGGWASQHVSGRDLPKVPMPARYGPREPFDAAVRARCAALGERLRAAILPNPASLAQRAAAARNSLDENLLRSLVLDHYPRPRLAHLDRAAAIVLAEARAEANAEKEANLAHAALQRLWEEAPEGAAWSITSDYCPGCGMGFTPSISRHFLTYYAR